METRPSDIHPGCSHVGVAARAADTVAESQPLRRDALAQHRSASRRADESRGRASEPAVHLLHRDGERRRLEDHRRRPDVEADLRRSADRLHRLGRGRAVRSEHLVRRKRRRVAAPRPGGWRRHLQVDRRRRHVDAPRIARRAADSEDRRRPAEPQSPLRRRARPPVRPQRGARHLQVDQWRADVRARVVQRCQHRRQGRRHRSLEPRHRLRDDVGAAAGPVGERGVGWHERRDLQVDRWRHDVETAHAGAAAGHRQRRARHRTEQPAPRLRDARSRLRCYRSFGGPRVAWDGHLSIRRRGRDVDAHHRGHAPGQSNQRSRVARPPERSRHADRHRRRQLQIDGRRENVRPVQGRAGWRRQPEHLVEPQRSQHHAAGHRSGRSRHAEWRSDVELVVHAADCGALPRDG